MCRLSLFHEMQKTVCSAGVETETRNHLTQPPVLDANSSTRRVSSSNPEVCQNLHLCFSLASLGSISFSFVIFLG